MSDRQKKFWVVIGFLLLTILHFDFWWFGTTGPIVLGFMPFSLWFQVLMGGIVSCVYLHFAYQVIWPRVPDQFEE